MARKRDYFTSPRGRAEYPHLITPDTKFHAGGVYKTNLIVPGGEAMSFCEAIDERMEKNLQRIEENGKDPGQIHCPYEEREDGTVAFSFKSKAKGETRDGTPFTRSVAVFDAAGQPVTDLDSIDGGSILRVAGEFVLWGPFGATGSGVSLRINAVQIIELREWAPDAETYGFAEEEDGFVAGEEEDTECSMTDEAEQAKDPADFDF